MTGGGGVGQRTEWERMEHESCGVGAVVDTRPMHRTVSDALTIVERLAHRAGTDALGTTGDGVGILTQLPHALFAAWAADSGVKLGEARDYGVGMLFVSPAALSRAQEAMEAAVQREGLTLLGWRDVPVRPELLGEGARRTMPAIAQVFVARPSDTPRGADFDRCLYLLRRAFEKICPEAYVCSLSSRTIVYKGMMLVTQLRSFYADLQNEAYASAVAMVHSRFSTNTQPSWPKAHPHRMLLHNGEINTIRGNADRMLAREETMRSPVLGERMAEAFPVVNPDGSDSAMLDNALEFLAMNGLPLALAGMILLPEPWQGKRETTPWRELYRYYATMMEPWDGPAAVLCTDGDTVCAFMDRNGLRPLRCALTDEGRLLLSSEAGALYEEEEHIVRRWRLTGGSLLTRDLSTGELLEGNAVKARYAARKPYSRWMQSQFTLEDLPAAPPSSSKLDEKECRRLCLAFGYTYEDVNEVLLPMAQKGTVPIGSMGADEPLAALSKARPPLSRYFKQRFAQVTNPPIDALRETLKTDTAVYVGDHGNLLADSPENCAVLELPTPILTEDALARIRAIDRPGWKVRTLSLLYEPENGMERALDRLFAACDQAYAQGVRVLILSDRGVNERYAALPSLLAVSALEQHLVRTRRRTAVSVLVETGEMRDAHEAALLVAFGARAILPYLAQNCVAALCGRMDKTPEQAVADYNRALVGGIMSIASKMGVSTLQAYQSAQLFEAVGLDADLLERYFTNTPGTLGGVGLARIEEDTRWHHDRAFSSDDPTLDRVGVHKLRKAPHAEEHLYTPEVINALQRAVWENNPEQYARYAHLLEEEGPQTPRGLMDFCFERCTPIPLSQVEPASVIVRRFQTGAMSYGSLSKEAHECLAQAMNHLGGRSNSGEGGELPQRFGTERNSAVKQVASGRFGVTAAYLRSASEIQIKMAQGAKPGEGGHLPGTKVSPSVARTRCSTPGISLISPPPHHDIYSIEDLAQLIYDLKCVNPSADISVKLVSSCGVGTVACGVAKAGAQAILISGGEGGTGAAPLSSIHGAGLPWEIGLAQAHRALCQNGLRERVCLETDGKLMTGRDVAVALLLGAESFAFATAPLVALGCRMMRVCNLDTCPFGIATQNPELRKRFKGKPEYVERYMLFVAEELRGIMAKLGARTVDELVGRGDLLRARRDAPLDVSSLTGFDENRRFDRTHAFTFHLESRADAQPAAQMNLSTADRSFGAMLPPAQTPQSIVCRGCGGQSFGAFLTEGYTLTLLGECNDYLGKGLSGGTLAVRPEHYEHWHEDDALIGNVALFGATGGSAFIAGTAGERFCVRNSGAMAVVEGVGDHGCEYMTGGRAVVLGPIGENFAAGMSGGIAYVLDAPAGRINPGMVDCLPVMGPYAAELRTLLEKHASATASPRAARILERFAEILPRFRMIFPREYRRLMEKR